MLLRTLKNAEKGEILKQKGKYFTNIPTYDVSKSEAAVVGTVTVGKFSRTPFLLHSSKLFRGIR
jgi:hypothetical protein